MPSGDFEKKMKKLNITELKLKYHELDVITDKIIDKEEELRIKREFNEDDKWFVFSLIKKKENNLS